MADIIALGEEIPDFHTLVDEVELLIPKYLDELDKLEKASDFVTQKHKTQNIAAYWERLSYLFHILEGSEHSYDLGIDFRQVCLNSLQKELKILEKLYMEMHHHICLVQCDHDTCSVWEAQSALLKRMDTILELQGFASEHQDRIFVRDILRKNGRRRDKMMERRIASDS